ncbi:MAG TPA: hypothetical protein VF364_13195 [Candidatus Limnocylindria bacterium]
MTDETALIYLETDDEVTSVVRRIRATDAPRVVLVAPGRSRATSSVVALRLLARVGEEADRGLSVVGDALTRSLAVEAGLDAYGSVEDARNAVGATPIEPGSKGAAIHVVRGTPSDDTVATPAWTDADAETRPVAVVPRPAPQSRPAPTSARRARRALPLALLLGGLAALLVGVGVIGAVILPAATVRIVPRSEPIPLVPYDIRIEDPERIAGTASAEATVTATGTYPIQAAATGTVVFLNWNVVDVDVPAGTLVAAGDQAFETTAAVLVTAGSLTPEGTVQAGEGAVEVVAAAVGPAANVPAEAIDQVLSQDVDVRLRGFANNDRRRVVNPAATAGGVDTTGPEFTEDDVSAARAALLESLDEAVAEELAGTETAIFADPAERAEATIDGLDGLAGARDEETAEVSGTLAYERLFVEREEVIDLARERFATDASAVPDGHELLPGTIEVELGETRREGDTLVISVGVRGASTPIIDRSEVMERVQGRSEADAIAALADIGNATVDLWPGWVGEVPGLEWRIDVAIAGEPDRLPGASASDSDGSAAP